MAQQIVKVSEFIDAGLPVGVEQGAFYVLRGPDGTRATFNDPRDIDHVGFLTEIPSGFDSPDVRESSDLIVEGDGGVHGNFYFGRRPWTLTGIIDPRPDPTRDFSEVLEEVFVNLITNPSAEVNTAGTFAGPGTLSRDQSVGYVKQGAYNFAISADGSGNALFGNSGIALPVTDVAYTFAVFARKWTAPAATIVVAIRWYDSVGAFISSSVTNPIVMAPGLNRYALTAVAPPGAVEASPALSFANGGGSQPQFYVDLQTFGQGADVGENFDGSTYPNGFPKRTAWLGTANASKSVLYNVTRESANAATVANRRITQLQRASRALRGDCVLGWTPQGGAPVQIAGRRQALRIGDRLPKSFQLAAVSSERRIQSQIVKSIAAAGGASISAENQGNTDTPLTVTLLGAWTNPIVTSPTGEQIRLNVTTIAGDTTVIDFAAKTVKRNGASIYSALQFPASRWYELPPGVNVLTASGNGTGATWRVDFRDSWE